MHIDKAAHHPLIIILGPTASGKTKLAVSIAKEFNGEIISADSRQVFTGMDIGTGKDLEEYKINGEQITHHLIDIRQAGETYNVNSFKEDFYHAFNLITAQKKLPILCGGTGMYIHSLLLEHEFTAIPSNSSLRAHYQNHSKKELQEQLSTYPDKFKKHADLTSSKRIIRAIEIAEFLKFNELPKINKTNFNALVIGLHSQVETRRERILKRLEDRLGQGLINEVESLLSNGVSLEMLTFYGLEYKFVASYIANEIDFPMLIEKLGVAICQYAKRQMTFFRKMEKDGVTINWFNTDNDFQNIKNQAVNLIKANYS